MNMELYNKNIELLRKDILPESFKSAFAINLDANSFSTDYPNRYDYIKEFGYTLFGKSWIEPLAEYLKGHKCLEIMAGRGLLSHFLRKYGVDIVATDNYSWKDWEDNRCNVVNMDCLYAVNTYGRSTDYILCSWPYMDDNAFISIRQMRKVNPTCRFILIGENEGGCTANDKFFEFAEYIQDEKIIDINRHYTRWAGISDHLSLYK